MACNPNKTWTVCTGAKQPLQAGGSREILKGLLSSCTQQRQTGSGINEQVHWWWEEAAEPHCNPKLHRRAEARPLLPAELLPLVAQVRTDTQTARAAPGGSATTPQCWGSTLRLPPDPLSPLTLPAAAACRTPITAPCQTQEHTVLQ